MNMVTVTSLQLVFEKTEGGCQLQTEIRLSIKVRPAYLVRREDIPLIQYVPSYKPAAKTSCACKCVFLPTRGWFHHLMSAWIPQPAAKRKTPP